MATDARIRKAWLRWLTEQRYVSGTPTLRGAFEAGYRAKRRDNAHKENPQKLVKSS